VCPSEEDYEQMVIRKCGGLFRLIIDLLRICSSNILSEKQIRMINELCQCLALLFQIRDDYCSLMSAEYSQKKSYCEDLSEGKYSFIMIHALQTYPDDHRLANLLKQHTYNIDLKRQAVHLLHQFGSLNYTRQKCLTLAKQSHELIDQLRGNISLKMIVNELMCAFDVPVEDNTLTDVTLF
jgi:geranylgeranyl diphosphate synthase, type III